MRVLIITVRADTGGGPEHIFSLIKKSKQEVDFFVACPEDKPYYKRYESVVGKDKLIKIPHRKFTFSHFLKFYRFIKLNKIELIHSHGKGAGIYSRPLSLFTGRKCIHTFHGLHIDDYNGLSRFLYILLEKFLSFMTDKIIAVSKGEKELLIKNKIVQENKTITIENGIDIPIKNHYLFLEQSVIKDKKIKIIAVNRFNYQKNPELLIEIAVELKKILKEKNFIIEVLGNGDSFEEIKNLLKIKKLDNIIKLSGVKENPREYYKDALCFLSTSRWEGMPLAPLEAMSEGLPVIATDVVGNRDVIKHNETGLLYKINSPEKAALYINNLTVEGPLRKRLSNSAYNEVKTKYNITLSVNKTVELYKLIKNL